MSDEATTIPKSEMDRKLAAWKEQEKLLKEQLAEANAKVAQLQPLADRATAAEAKVTEMEQAAARDATFNEAGIVDARARKILLTQYTADAAGLAAGETPPDLKTFLEKAKDDPYLAPMFAAQGVGAGAGTAQGAAAGTGAAKQAAGRGAAAAAGVANAAAGAVVKRDYQAEIAGLLKAGKVADAKKVREEWSTDLAARTAIDVSSAPG